MYLKDGIDSILAIDKKTKELVEQTDRQIEKIRSDLREKLTDMENESIEHAKKIGQEKSQAVIDEFNEKVSNLRKQNENKLKGIEQFYKNHEAELLDEAFELLVGKNAR